MPRIEVRTLNGYQYTLSSADPQACAAWLWEMTQRMGIESHWQGRSEFTVRIFPLWAPGAGDESADWPAALSNYRAAPGGETPLECGRQLVKIFTQFLDEYEQKS